MALVGSTGSARALAQERRGTWAGGSREHEVWRGPDLGRWRRGHWFHGEHFSRLGWWWIVDGAWFFYPAPVYPYPDSYIPPAAVTLAPPAQSSPQYWYYCASANGYPYVMNCPKGWQRVAPQPAPP